MPSLPRGSENTTELLNWFISVGGVLTDAAVVQYRVFDIIGGLPGTQIFPLPSGTYEDVSSGLGHVTDGFYYAFDNTTGKGWTPDILEPLGTHRIEWRWKLTAGSEFQMGFEDFQIVVESAGASDDSYISLEDIRNLGMPTPPTDATIIAQIALWQASIERATRQWFVPRSLVLKFDGTDSDAIHLGVPIIAIESLKLNNDENPLDPELFKVYSAVRYPDDRSNPRIKLTRDESDNIFRDVHLRDRPLRFRKGRQNQEVKGTFGYIEPDGSVPLLIQHALTKLVVEKLANPVFNDPASPVTVPVPPIVGTLVEEWTDGHKRKYGARGGDLKARAPGLSGITADQEILDILRLFKAPIGIATPAHPSHT